MRSPILDLVEKHEEYRSNAINLLPSENFLSDEARKILASDLASRYSLEINDEVHGSMVRNAYGGTRYAEEITHLTRKKAEELFGAKYAEVQPIGGHIAAEIMLLSTLEKGDPFMAIGAQNGGYDGYMPEYLPEMFGHEMHEIPFDEERMQIDYEALERKIRDIEPKLIVLGASYFPFPYDIRRIREFYDGYIGYDGSHVMGFIASGAFQRDIGMLDILVGSTHKSLYGPQGGLVLVYNEELIENVKFNTTWRTLDNPHLNRIAALGQALYELEADRDYGKRVIGNAKALGKALYERGIPIRFHPVYTESHQLLLDTDALLERWGLTPQGFRDALDKKGIIVDAVGRLGTAEVTHRGMGPKDMEKIADLILSAIDS
jgi:glycine hydroxymethyltransferase